MKRFLAGLGIALMCFGGIGVAAVLLNLPTFFRSGDNPLAINLLVFIILLAVFAGLFALGCKLKSMGGPAQTKQSTAAAPAPKYETRHRATEPPAQKTAPQTPNPPAPESVSMNREPSGFQPQPTVREIIGLPEEVDIIRCPFDDQLKDIGPDGLDNESHVALWLRPRENADAASVIRGLADCLKQIGARAAALKNGHFIEYWSIMKHGNYLYVLLVDRERWLEGVPADILALCRQEKLKELRVAVPTRDGIRDLVTGTEYMLRYQEWPGSADDAATYGKWWLEESRPAAKAADVPEPAAESAEPMKRAVMWNGTMVSTVLDQIRDSSVQELRAFSNTRLIAKFGNELYIPQPVQGKIKLWRDGKVLHTVSTDETVELYAAQFDVQVQGEWFLCFGVSKAEPSEGSFDCLIDDPKFKLPSQHSQHSNYMWGSGVEVNSSQIEAVRLWRSKSLTDILAPNGAEI